MIFNVYGTKGRAAPLAEFRVAKNVLLEQCGTERTAFRSLQLETTTHTHARTRTATLRKIPQLFIHIVSLHSDTIVLEKIEKSSSLYRNVFGMWL